MKKMIFLFYLAILLIVVDAVFYNKRTLEAKTIISPESPSVHIFQKWPIIVFTLLVRIGLWSRNISRLITGFS